MKNKELQWCLIALLISLVLTGFVFDFNFFRKTNIRFPSNSDFLVYPIQFAFVLFVILLFVIFLKRELGSGFTNIIGMWILLLSNSFLIIFLIFMSYVAYVLFIINLVFDLFTFKNTRQFDKEMLVCGILLVLFISAEFVLIKKLIKLLKK